jgi:hypothetical protein
VPYTLGERKLKTRIREEELISRAPRLLYELIICQGRQQQKPAKITRVSDVWGKLLSFFPFCRL